MGLYGFYFFCLDFMRKDVEELLSVEWARFAWELQNFPGLKDWSILNLILQLPKVFESHQTSSASFPTDKELEFCWTFFFQRSLEKEGLDGSEKSIPSNSQRWSFIRTDGFLPRNASLM